MSNSEIKNLIDGSEAIDYVIDWPSNIYGWSLVLHPHPLYGGSRDNKVVTTISRECVRQGLISIRPNFRGVGESSGVFDNGIGETEDMVRLIKHVIELYPYLLDLPLFISGFSFGSAVAAELSSRILKDNLGIRIRNLILIGSAVQRFQFSDLVIPSNTVIIHGEVDEVVAFSEMLDWARPRAIPIIMIPSCSHFFHGKLLSLRQMVSNCLKSSII
ncbi:putative hydrolase of the alpha/beta superfamily [Candidatus Kinetoplastibacterium desouzaii TCC079E]|uniref:Putative hydrolase of the alpha/beta superfamily n=1 Tax=Candidatus Kinetoplastidibacterium desouzai TCC079E TaxID=1208919 RepID=M1L3D7_9PROT|nr:hydrolase of the alpha/beta superfamily [Candidatus Kinetoplastibacterium desouzaii]AGF47238.1 putative hydrolase of the alpha/beta superfamily [Candidatus Kinetoplastibacterium desouzaii TCC079E]